MGVTPVDAAHGGNAEVNAGHRRRAPCEMAAALPNNGTARDGITGTAPAEPMDGAPVMFTMMKAGLGDPATRLGPHSNRVAARTYGT